jgi:hypothetical protein
LAAQSGSVSCAEQIPGRGEVTFFAYAQNDRHKDQHNGGLIDKHGTTGGESEDSDLEEELIPSGRSKQASTDHFSSPGADQSGTEDEHRRDHDHGNAAKAGESFLRGENSGPFSSQPSGLRVFWPAALSLIGQRPQRVFSLFASRIQPKYAAAPLPQSLTWCTRPEPGGAFSQGLSRTG